MSVRFSFTSFSEIPPQWDEKKMHYLLFQREKSPTTGKLHWQGYIEMLKKSKMDSVKSALKDNTIHIEACKGTTQQCIAYCTKVDTAVEENYYEFGKPRPTQGTRTDLANDKKILEETKDVSQVSFGNYVRYHKAMKNWLLDRIKPRDPKTCKQQVIVLHSINTGKGKSWKASELCEGQSAYWQNGTKWWDGYQGQDYIVLDEFSMAAQNELYIRQLLDIYPFRIEIKGYMCYFNPKKIIITTNDDITKWSDNIRRRVTEFIDMNDNIVPKKTETEKVQPPQA